MKVLLSEFRIAVLKIKSKLEYINNPKTIYIYLNSSNFVDHGDRAE